jgi:hypothetical protein
VRLVAVRPSADPPTSDEASYVAAALLAGALSRASDLGHEVVDLLGGLAEPGSIRQALSQGNDAEVLVAYSGHGDVDAWLRTLGTTLLVPQDLSGLSGLRMYACACYTSAGFGRTVVSHGIATHYLGYSDEFIIHYQAKTLEPTQGFAEVTTVAVEALTDPPAKALKRVRSEYRKWIRHWERRGPLIAALFRANLDVLELVK